MSRPSTTSCSPSLPEGRLFSPCWELKGLGPSGTKWACPMCPGRGRGCKPNTRKLVVLLPAPSFLTPASDSQGPSPMPPPSLSLSSEFPPLRCLLLSWGWGWGPGGRARRPSSSPLCLLCWRPPGPHFHNFGMPAAPLAPCSALWLLGHRHLYSSQTNLGITCNVH